VVALGAMEQSLEGWRHKALLGIIDDRRTVQEGHLPRRSTDPSFLTDAAPFTAGSPMGRRDFVRAAGTMIGAIGFGSACGGRPTPPNNITGEIQPLFFSDWSGAALGSGSDAIRDNGKWTLVGGFGHEVVNAAGLGFPSARVCKFVANRSNNGFALLRKTGMPIPAVGVTRHYRWYVRMTFPDALLGNGDHPWQDGNAVSDCNYIVGVHYGSDVGPARNGQWQLGATFIGNPNGAFDNGPWLNKNETYRVEAALERLTATTYDFSMQVFNSANAPVFNDEHFPADFGGGTLATRGPWTFANVNNLDGFNCGTNDFETAGNNWWTSTFDYGYQGCFAIADNQGWIGPYGSVIGETDG
jgi:hypothetical protein